jgi:hypothetical protein
MYITSQWEQAPSKHKRRKQLRETKTIGYIGNPYVLVPKITEETIRRSQAIKARQSHII